MAFVLVYKGGAMDHEVKPQVYAKGQDGRPDKRRVSKPAETKFREMDTIHVLGLALPKGKEVRTSDAAVIAKARSLKCCEVREDAKPKA